MVQSLEHGRPIVNGYSGQRPAFFSSLVEGLAELPLADGADDAPRLRRPLCGEPGDPGRRWQPASPLVERARLDGGIVYELRWTPAAIEAVDAAASSGCRRRHRPVLANRHAGNRRV